MLKSGHGVHEDAAKFSEYVFAGHKAQVPVSLVKEPGLQAVHTPALPLKPSEQSQEAIEVWPVRSWLLCVGQSEHTVDPWEEA